MADQLNNLFSQLRLSFIRLVCNFVFGFWQSNYFYLDWFEFLVAWVMDGLVEIEREAEVLRRLCRRAYLEMFKIRADLEPVEMVHVEIEV